MKITTARMPPPASASAALVACNIYISAAASCTSHPATLLSLLQRAQDHCLHIRQSYYGKVRDGDGIDGHHNEIDFTKCHNNAHASTNNVIQKTIQSHQSQLQNAPTTTKNITYPCSAPVAIIHAYADIPYDRSSIHLAGYSECVADVATRIISNALHDLDSCVENSSGDNDNTDDRIEEKKNDKNKIKDVVNNDSNEYSRGKTRHPFVGLIDHVSVMPLAWPYASEKSADSQSVEDASIEENQNVTNLAAARDAAAHAARQIGESLSQSELVKVHYYGLACPNNTPLATVRREKTSFFNSGGAQNQKHINQTDFSPLHSPSSPSAMARPIGGSTTIGTPSNFVENFNILLTSNCTHAMAKSLTQCLRGRNADGVPGVEALTLPYTEDTYEVACNLTSPSEGGSVNEILHRLEKWVGRQKQQLILEKSDGKQGEKDDCGGCDDGLYEDSYDYFVDRGYRVGTTEEQCIEVLTNKYQKEIEDVASTGDIVEEYDNEVFCRFQQFLHQ